MVRRLRDTAQTLATVGVLTVLWCLLWGKADAYTVVGGLAVSGLLVWAFYLPPLALTGRLHPLWAAWAFLRLTGDIVVASLTVAAQALWPWWHPVGAVVRLDLHSADELIITLTTEAISLVPGSLVVEIDRNDGVLYLHVLGARTSADVARARRHALAQEARIIMALGSPAERAQARRWV
ncbi:MAG: Na+/H+ antiporter subunit E [Pseudoclavibacter caeni]